MSPRPRQHNESGLALVQWALRRNPQWRIPERNKAFVLCADLAAGMTYIVMLRDLEEVPGGTHDWMLSCHGWGILFLQVRLSLESSAKGSIYASEHAVSQR